MGYQGENNNMMDANVDAHVGEHIVPKMFSYANDEDTVLAVNQLQNQNTEDSSVIMNLWNKLKFYTLPLAPSTTNLVERSSQIMSLQAKEISGNKDSWNKESESELDFILKPQRPTKYCLNYIRKIRPVVTNILDKNSQVTFVQQTLKPSRKCEAKSDVSYLLNTKQYQEPEACTYIDQCQERPPPSFSFQRLDSGIEELPYPRSTRCQIDLNSERIVDSCFVDSFCHNRTQTQIDLDSLYISTMIRTVVNQATCLSEDRVAETGKLQGCHKAISFFIDIREPFEQKPLGEEYKFLACDECDSMFSDKCSESSDEDYSDDDFIFFHESSNEEMDGFGFNFTLNACNPTELSCSVRATSTGCFDISMDTSARQNPRNANKESSVSVKIGVRLGSDGKTCESSEYNSCDVNECVDLNDPSSFEFGSEFTHTNSLKTFTSSFTVGKNPSGSDDNESILINSNHASEVTDKNISDNPKTNFCDTNNIVKKKCRKKVCFQKDEDLVEVHQMIQWDFAYREARKGTWELEAVDRWRFMQRINDLELILSPCLRRKLELMQNM